MQHPATPLDQQSPSRSKRARHVLARVTDDSSFIQKLSPVLAHPFKVGFSESMDTVFLFAGRSASSPSSPCC